MSKPGRRAAPKPSRFSGLRATRGAGGRGGRRADGATTGEFEAVRDDTSPFPAIPPTPAAPRDPASYSDGPLGRRLRAMMPPDASAGSNGATELPAPPTASLEAPATPATGTSLPVPAPPQPVGYEPPPSVLPDGVGPVPMAEPDQPIAITAVPATPQTPQATQPRWTRPVDEEQSAIRRQAARYRLWFWSAVLLIGVLDLALAALHVGPGWLDGFGAVLVLSTYSWAAAARTGGRQVVYAVLGLVIGVVALLVDGPVLRSGAAVMTCVVSGVLAVVITVPAKNFLTAVREVVIATAVASVGAFATVGFQPVASTARFEYITLALGFGAILVLVWRFAAGLHGLGTRGLAIVVVGTLLLGASLAYTEMLRQYGVVEPTRPVQSWLRDTVGAAPSMIMVLLGVPALVWGVHMRARRRQGWWVCTFGAAATLPVAQHLVNLDTSYIEAGLQTTYSVALGLLVGWLLIRLDLQLTGTRGARARAAEEVHAVRPEPRRFSSL